MGTKKLAFLSYWGFVFIINVLTLIRKNHGKEQV